MSSDEGEVPQKKPKARKGADGAAEGNVMISLRIPRDIDRDIREVMRATGQDLTSTVNRLIRQSLPAVLRQAREDLIALEDARDEFRLASAQRSAAVSALVIRALLDAEGDADRAAMRVIELSSQLPPPEGLTQEDVVAAAVAFVQRGSVRIGPRRPRDRAEYEAARKAEQGGESA